MKLDSGRRWSLMYTCIIAVAVFPLGLLAENFVGPGSGLPTSLCAAMIVAAIWWRWDLSDRPWFWGTVAIITALHLPLIMFVHWTTHWIPAAVSTPFCLVDGLLILKIFSLGERFIDRVAG